ncbi:HAD-superfamily phosphatase [Hesseltinella vesiculosa]|uniref:HAD-superfamily phosphatase n=1 Tax=Hesseltinella vesiculosa TaxID=101127 RepID=A0A1X2GK18_9FUNG|nr:HAD-superfamily phosphatase [Hesseltinella vesiculosa]
MGQSLNWAGILNTFRVLANPSLVMPQLIVKDIREIPFQQLKSKGIKVMAFDKDNCLTAPYETHIHPPFEEAWQRCKDTFGADHIIIVSNSAGTPDDKNGEKAKKAEQELGVHVLRHETKKPSGGDTLMLHVQEPGSHIAMVGDRLLTDIVYGNLNGNLTIWTKQVITEKGDNRPAVLIRRWEHQLMKILTHLDVQPYPHPFFTANDKKN